MSAETFDNPNVRMDRRASAEIVPKFGQKAADELFVGLERFRGERIHARALGMRVDALYAFGHVIDDNEPDDNEDLSLFSKEKVTVHDVYRLLVEGRMDELSDEDLEMSTSGILFDAIKAGVLTIEQANYLKRKLYGSEETESREHKTYGTLNTVASIVGTYAGRLHEPDQQKAARLDIGQRLTGQFSKGRIPMGTLERNVEKAQRMPGKNLYKGTNPKHVRAMIVGTLQRSLEENAKSRGRS